MKKLALLLVFTGISLGLSVPAYAYDDAEPEVDSLTFSPSIVDVSSSDAVMTLTVRASDATGIRQVLVSCSQGTRSLFTAAIYPNYEVTDPSRGGVLGIMYGSSNLQTVNDYSLTKDQTTMTISFAVTIRSGQSPGRADCLRYSEDTLGNTGNRQFIANFTVVRDGVGLETESPSPEASTTPSSSSSSSNSNTSTGSSPSTSSTTASPTPAQQGSSATRSSPAASPSTKTESDTEEKEVSESEVEITPAASVLVASDGESDPITLILFTVFGTVLIIGIGAFTWQRFGPKLKQMKK
jgi:hypothetical protein